MELIDVSIMLGHGNVTNQGTEAITIFGSSGRQPGSDFRSSVR